MADLEVEAIGEAPAASGRRPELGDRPPWGMPVAVAIVGLLVLGVLVVVAPRILHHVPNVETAAIARSGPGAETALVDTTVAALTAWGRFVGTGDLDTLRPYFDPDGPQYRQLTTEAAVLRASSTGAYDVVVEPSATKRTARRAFVAANIHWRKLGEADQQLRWIVELRAAPASGWRLWTVRKEPQ